LIAEIIKNAANETTVLYCIAWLLKINFAEQQAVTLKKMLLTENYSKKKDNMLQKWLSKRVCKKGLKFSEKSINDFKFTKSRKK